LKDILNIKFTYHLFQQILFETLLGGPGFESREEQEILSSPQDI